MPKVRLALAQTNPTVGALEANVEAILATVADAAAGGADVVVFGEMVVTGYPIEDLATRESFVAKSEAAVLQLAKSFVSLGFGEISVIVGHPSKARKRGWAIAHNSISVLRGGEIIGQYHKHHLPNYSVFDEYRNFVAGDKLLTFEHGGLKFATVICEDIWQSGGPVAEISKSGANVTLVINGSPFEIDKDDRRLQLVQELARTHKTPTAYVNLVGGQDDLVFDGDSLMVDASGDVIGRCAQFEQDLLFIDFENGNVSQAGAHPIVKKDDLWQTWNALTLGLRDYCAKNGFKSVVLGLSGGIDSSIVAAIAVEALGAEHVHGVAMPSRYSSDGSKTDAYALAEALGIDCRTISIEPVFEAYLSMLAPSFEGKAADLTEENLQSRCRGQILMALSNKFGWMVLTTGNKSELAVGYFTIYGDSVGGYAVIKDLLKTDVFGLSRYVNQRAGREIIPEAVLTKPPSAELRPDQRDDQSLPPYDVLDPILALYVEQDRTAAEIIELGHPEDIVRRIARLVDINEYKRRQCPPGVRVSEKAFGKDRRLPITNGYRG